MAANSGESGLVELGHGPICETDIGTSIQLQVVFSDRFHSLFHTNITFAEQSDSLSIY